MTATPNFLNQYLQLFKNNPEIKKYLESLKSGKETDFIADKIRNVLNNGINDHILNIGEMINDDNQIVFYSPNGIQTYLEELTHKDTKITPIIRFNGGDSKFQLDCAICYSSDYSEKFFAFTNGINNPEGGAHVTGFRTAIVKLINNICTTKGIFKKETDKFGYDDLKEGIRVVLAIKMVDPQFTSQSKVKLGSTVARTLTDKIVLDKLGTYFEENPSVVSQIVSKAQLAMKARLAAKAARDSVLRKSVLESTALPGKLADCSEKSPELSEIYIVEGDSAGGSAKQGRDRKTQAILPLRGKVLNTEKATLDRIMGYEGIRNMITAFGTGIGERFDIEKLRYHKIILMTDADVDGAHITTLLLTFLYRYMPELIENGHIYMARPPLYGITIKKKVTYVYSDEEKFEFLKKYEKENPGFVLVNAMAEEADDENTDSVEETNELTKTEENSKVSKNVSVPTPKIQRYKGLGEMNPEQLWSTTMDPASRYLFQVTVGDAAVASQVFDHLMGAEVAPRRQFIEENAVYAEIELV
jgi:DNA gyrase subunit B